MLVRPRRRPRACRFRAPSVGCDQLFENRTSYTSPGATWLPSTLPRDQGASARGGAASAVREKPHSMIGVGGGAMISCTVGVNVTRRRASIQGAIPVPRHGDLYRTDIGQHSLAAYTISGVLAVLTGWVALVVADVVGDLTDQRGLQNPFSQLLQQLSPLAEK